MAGWVRWMEHGLKERRDTSSVVLFSLATLPMLLVLWGLQAHAQADAEVLARYHPHALAWTQRLLAGLIVWLLACAGWAALTRDRMGEERPVLAALTLMPALLGLTGVALAYGLKDTPMAMVVVEELVVARALFPLRRLRGSMAWTLFMVVAYEVACSQSWLAEAPLRAMPVFAGESLDAWWGTCMRILLQASVWPFAGVLFFLFDRMARHRSDLKTLARTDALTGLANRREFMARLAEESHRQERGGQACCVLMCDIDHFKRINDQHGHQAGDAVLIEVGRLLGAGVRQRVDLAARIGGEEFALILPETDLQGARRVAEKLAQALKARTFRFQGQDLRVTMSVGVAEVEGGRGDQAMRAADIHLYAAKQAGRDRVVVLIP